MSTADIANADANQKRIDECREIERMAASCRHVSRDGRQSVPTGMAAALMVRGYSVEQAKAAFDQFAKTGHWSTAEGDICFGEKPKPVEARPMEASKKETE